jgi:hypothetical protein
MRQASIGPSDGQERRAAERHPCGPQTTGQVIDPLDERAAAAGPWNVSTGGVCVLIEPHHAPGTFVEVGLCNRAAGASLHAFAEVVQALLVPSVREMWLTGCSFQSESVTDEQLRPYV